MKVASEVTDMPVRVEEISGVWLVSAGRLISTCCCAPHYEGGLIAFILRAQHKQLFVIADDAEYYTGITAINEGVANHHLLLDIHNIG